MIKIYLSHQSVKDFILFEWEGRQFLGFKLSRLLEITEQEFIDGADRLKVL